MLSKQPWHMVATRLEAFLLSHEDAREFSQKLAQATKRVCEDYKVGDVEYEEPFSDQLCGRLKETLVDFQSPHIDWQADVATEGRGRGRLRGRTLKKTTEEPLFGADIVMTIDVDTPEYKTRKGFLVQSKRLEVGQAIASSEHKRLVDQCEKMLRVTPASMVFLYSVNGVAVLPATAVLATQHRRLNEVATYEIEWLFHDFAICWFGDPLLQATDSLSLEGLRYRMDADAAVRFVGHAKPGLDRT